MTTPRRVFCFDRFTLDLERCSLRRGGEDLRLRPKSFDVLRYLAEHPGRVVTKDELIQGVWPDIHVTDDSLVNASVTFVKRSGTTLTRSSRPFRVVATCSRPRFPK